VDDGPGAALYFRILDAWNRRDAATYAALFAEDGSAVGFDGSQLVGRAEIERSLREIFDHHQTPRYVAKVREERLIAADVILVRAVCGMVPAGTHDINPDVNAIQSLVAINTDGNWRGILFQNTPAQFHGRPDLAATLTAELRQLL
jgi:uncharacterized protein (TIGR02246 family)